MKIEKKIKEMPPQWRHKIHYGESLAQMGQRLGISREAVRRRIKQWGSPEHSARPIYHKGQRHKNQWGETLEQMGKRLGISSEAVRGRIKRWGSPEHRNYRHHIKTV